MSDKEKAATPLVEPYDQAASDTEPKVIETDAAVSTDANGDEVVWPDRGGTID